MTGYDNKRYGAYQNAAQAVDETAQLLMLYDGAINFMRQAKEAIEAKDYEKRYNIVNKVIAIIAGLNSCLNFTDETRKTAEALDDFYQNMDMRLLYIQCDNSLKSCDDVIKDLQTMRNAWEDTIRNYKNSEVAKSNSDAVQVTISDNKAMEEPISQGSSINEILKDVHISV